MTRTPESRLDAIERVVLILARNGVHAYFPVWRELQDALAALERGGGIVHKLPSRDLFEQRVDLLTRRLSELAAEGKALPADEVQFQHEMLPVGWDGKGKPPNG